MLGNPSIVDTDPLGANLVRSRHIGKTKVKSLAFLGMFRRFVMLVSAFRYKVAAIELNP